MSFGIPPDHMAVMLPPKARPAQKSSASAPGGKRRKVKKRRFIDDSESDEYSDDMHVAGDDFMLPRPRSTRTRRGTTLLHQASLRQTTAEEPLVIDSDDQNEAEVVLEDKTNAAVAGNVTVVCVIPELL